MEVSACAAVEPVAVGVVEVPDPGVEPTRRCKRSTVCCSRASPGTLDRSTSVSAPTSSLAGSEVVETPTVCMGTAGGGWEVTPEVPGVGTVGCC
eukprot:5480597-Pyramimonas_sp.AAC.1